MRRVVGTTAAATTCALCYEAWRLRPQWHKTGEMPAHGSRDTWLYRRCGDVAVFLATAAVLPISKILNRTEVQDMHHLRNAWERRHERPLLTVANHHGCIDDPLLFPLLLPNSLGLPLLTSANRTRWSLCKHDICYKNEVLAAFFGAGQTLPIVRGEGVEQTALKVFGSKLVPGNWVHIFPEGRIWQLSVVGGRPELYDGTPYKTAGEWQQPYRPYLRWGVGKIVADAPISPTIVPFYHTGMADVQPQSVRTERLLSPWPRSGNTIVVRAGEPFDVDDLLHAHRQRVSALRARAREVGTAVDAIESQVQEAEHALYSAITKRVEQRLRALETKVRSDLGLRELTQQQRGRQVPRPME